MDLGQADWDHIVSETRAGQHSLNEGAPSEGAETFEIDGTTVFFEIQ